jgi:cell division protein FtsQ
VKRATVMRLLPNRLRIAVVERTPVAFVRQGTHIGLIDASGVLLDMPSDAAGDPHYSFPVLTGLSVDDPLSTRAARMEIYGRFMKELDGGGEKVTENLSEVDVSNPEDVKAVIPSGGTDILVHFGDTDFLERFRHFQQHLPEWKQQYPKLASADMRYGQQVPLEMQPGAAVPLGSASEGHVAEPSEAVKTPAAAAPAAPVKPGRKAPVRVAAKSAPVGGKAVVKPRVVPARVKPQAAGATPVSAANTKMYAALAAARKQETTQPGQGQQ